MVKPFFSSLAVPDGILFGGDGCLARVAEDGSSEYLYPFGEGSCVGNRAYRIGRMVALEGRELLLGTDEMGLFRYEPGHPAVPFTQEAFRQVIALPLTVMSALRLAQYFCRRALCIRKQFSQAAHRCG